MEYPFSDIIIINKEKEYKLNKIILVRNSHYFEQLFLNFKEKDDKIINTDFDKDIWEYWLNEIYNSYMPNHITHSTDYIVFLEYISHPLSFNKFIDNLKSRINGYLNSVECEYVITQRHLRKLVTIKQFNNNSFLMIYMYICSNPNEVEYLKDKYKDQIKIAHDNFFRDEIKSMSFEELMDEKTNILMLYNGETTEAIAKYINYWKPHYVSVDMWDKILEKHLDMIDIDSIITLSMSHFNKITEKYATHIIYLINKGKTFKGNKKRDIDAYNKLLKKNNIVDPNFSDDEDFTSIFPKSSNKIKFDKNEGSSIIDK